MRDLKFEEYKYKYSLDVKRDSRQEAIDKFIKKLQKEEDMYDSDIREIIKKYIEKQNYLLAEERNARAWNNAPFDVVAGDPDDLSIIGFEIKSDRDSFTRLKSQLREYKFVCKEIYLVVHKKKIPDWLPSWCGVLRVNKKGECYLERNSWGHEPFDISTDYEWNELAKANGLGRIKDRLKDYFDILIKIRKNILFNRFFAEKEFDKETNHEKYKKWYPLSDYERSLIIGFDVPYHMAQLKKEVRVSEIKLQAIKRAIGISDSIQLKLNKEVKNE